MQCPSPRRQMGASMRCAQEYDSSDAPYEISDRGLTHRPIACDTQELLENQSAETMSYESKVAGRESWLLQKQWQNVVGSIDRAKGVATPQSWC